MKSSWLLITLLVAGAAFVAGRFSGGAVASAATEPVRVDVRPSGSNPSLILHYPDKNRVYIYDNSFIGYPRASCAYWFQLGAPGEMITRHQCPPPGSQ